MPNLYADMTSFKRRFANDATLDAVDQSEIEKLLEAASRAVDDFCDRRFYAATATRVFDGNDRDLMVLPDILATTGVKLDEDTDGTFEVTLTTPTDYWLIRLGHQDQDASPQTAIRLNTAKGSRTKFLDLPRLLQIAGTWGFTQATERLTPTATLADASTTTMTTSAAGDLGIGQTILVESEQLYISAGSGTSWTVTRGVNGTTAAAHTTKPIDRYVYVAEVRESALIQAARLWKRRETAFTTVIQNPGLGTIEVFRGLDADVERLLTPFRRTPV